MLSGLNLVRNQWAMDGFVKPCNAKLIRTFRIASSQMKTNSSSLPSLTATSDLPILTGEQFEFQFDGFGTCKADLKLKFELHWGITFERCSANTKQGFYDAWSNPSCFFACHEPPALHQSLILFALGTVRQTRSAVPQPGISKSPEMHPAIVN